jgi:hypothetical protein
LALVCGDNAAYLGDFRNRLLMTAHAASSAALSDRQWYIVGRWQEYEGEGRANLVRVLAVLAFYVVQMVHYYGYSDRSPAEAAFYQKATAIAGAWTILSVAVLYCLRAHVFPAALKYISTACDLILLTAVISLAAGPGSALVRAYPIVLAMAALRFSLSLVWFSTLGAMAGYMALVGMRDKVWFDDQHVVPVTDQLITLLSFAVAGIVLGQVIRRVRAVSSQYAERLARQRK